MAYSLTHPTCQTLCTNGGICGTPADVIKYYSTGKPNYRKRNGYWICSNHHKDINKIRNGHYTNYKKTFCENEDGRLGTVCVADIVDSCQLSVDHIDGDHSNDNPKNLQSLCLNCHALKTKLDTKNRAILGNTGYRVYQEDTGDTFRELFGEI